MAAPQINLPKGGGAIRGIGEKFQANPVTGSGSMTVPIFASPGRSGFGPELALSYDSGSGNSPFGLGWTLPVPAITRKTERGVPEYRDNDESDVFILAGAEDLVPFLIEESRGNWKRDSSPRVSNGKGYRVDRYRPRIEGSFALIERWTLEGDRQTHWRTVTRDNVTTIFGDDGKSRIADPANPLHVFSWLISRSYDDKGNVVVYTYKPEDYTGVDRFAANERNRDHAIEGPQRYLKRIHYGNVAPYVPDLERPSPVSLPAQSDWMFELVFDYGEHAGNAPTPAERTDIEWSPRRDPFSTYRAGFELRTHRLCERVLMFHHFPGEAGVGANCLVRSTDFQYQTYAEASDHLGSPFSQLQRAWQTGYKRKSSPPGTYLSRVMPPVEFEYSRPAIADSIREIDPASLENLPVGVTGPGYQWVDLDGEGLSGVLTEQAGAWFYKPNLGEGPRGPTFGPTSVVAERPSSAALGTGRQQFLDLAGDGALDLVEFGGDNPGLQERRIDGSWEPFVPFASLPNIDWDEPNLRLVDLTGNGLADALITEDDVFTWYPSLGEEGFAARESARQPRDEEQGPHLVFADGTESIFIADMSGDGLQDLVRIRNGQVCFWSSVGYGHFAAKVEMDNAPWFDHPDLYDPGRIRLADVDGSGPTDILYLGRDGAVLYVNESGNALREGRVLPFPVATENLDAVQVADLLGNGTACLVWSSPLPADASAPARYLDLMGGEKPHLLIGVKNNLGSETTIEYAPSTKFYLADKHAGRPWITRLPFPVHCVEQVSVTDRWRGTTFRTRYSYHHGYFDGVEREFRGFGRVEQVDVEDYGRFAEGNSDSPYITQDEALFQPPVKTITWTHTGAALEHQRILSQFQGEYFPNSLSALPNTPTALGGFSEKPLSEPDVNEQGLGAEEWRQAMRAFKGMTLREEVYELDVDALNPAAGSDAEDVPVRLFSAVTRDCKIRCLQPAADNRFAVFHVLESEALSYHYELDLRPVVFPADPRNVPPLRPDPRIAHTLNLSFDAFGNVQQSVAVGYRRGRPFDDPDLADHLGLIRSVQHEQHFSYVENRYTDVAESIDPAPGVAPIRYYRLPVPCEVETYELTGVTQRVGNAYFALSDFLGLDLSARYRPTWSLDPVVRKQYHELPTNTQPTMRLVGHFRTLFFDDDPGDAARFLQKPLPLGKLGKLGLPYELYKLALTKALLQDILADKFDAVVRTALDTPSASGYLPGTALAGAAGADEWWIRSGTAGFASDAAQHFYLPEKYTDAFGNPTTLRYDGRDLFVQSSSDALSNTTRVVRFDYRVLAAVELEDINANLTEAYLDVLGRVVAVAVKGKGAEADSLLGFDDDLANPTRVEVAAIFRSSPDRATLRRLLGNASTRFLYHFGEELGAGAANWATRPAGACSIVREQHAATLSAGVVSPLLAEFECSDGLGAVLMKRSQAEPEQAGGPLRWVVSGKTVLNNKGKPVKQYEPYFSNDADCCAEGDAHEEVGVTPLMFYDSVGRLIRTEMPDGSFSRVEFSPWHVKSFDANDTVTESTWYVDRGAPNPRTALSAGASAETRAAWLASKHSDTPSLTILDSLGREVIAVAHNRVEDAGGPVVLAGRRFRDERYATLTKVDAEGKPLWIRDARGNLVTQYVRRKPLASALQPISNTQEPTNFTPAYDLAENLLFQHSMDAGDRWMLNDAAGKPMFAWDVNQRQDAGGAFVSERRLLRASYDALHRPVAQRLAVNASPPRTVERWDYVDAGAPAPFANVAAAQNRNLCGQPYRHFHPGGLVQVEREDFKGNTVEIRQRLPLDHKAAISDWQMNPLSGLETETFVKITEFDALNRISRAYNWHRPATTAKRVAVYEPRYNERGLLAGQQLVVGAKRNAATSGRRYDEVANLTQRNDAILRIEYNAKGQKVFQKVGSGTITRYDYDPKTFRLRQLRTTRRVGTQRDPQFPAFASNLADPRVLQQLLYTYDPAGNITEIEDQAYKPVYWGGGIARPKSQYEYDPLYRLVSASARETAQGGTSARDGVEPAIAAGFPITGQTLRQYTQTYRYDPAGNFVLMRHVVAGDSAAGWTRHYESHPDSNRLRFTWTGSNRVAQVEHLYDTHGNMLNVARTPRDGFLRWDNRDMISSIDLGGGGAAFYQYDAEKQRTRKRIDSRTGGAYWERIDLGGYELYRRYSGTVAAPVEEIETLHLMNGQQRLLMVDDVLKTTRPGLPKATLYRYTLSDHLGSSTVEVDDLGSIISHEEFHPYGSTAYHSGRNTAEVKLKRYRYTGMERDEESGFNYHSARYNAGWLGRWFSADPLAEKAAPNPYAMVSGNPIRFNDPSGESGEETKIVEKQMFDVYPKGAVKRFSLRVSDPAGGQFRYIADAAVPASNEFMKYLMVVEHKGIPRVSGDPSTITPGQIRLFGTSKQPGLLDLYPEGVSAKIESSSLDWTKTQGQMKGDVIILRKGYNIPTVDTTSLPATKAGTADVYGTDSPGVKLRRGGQTLPVPRTKAAATGLGSASEVPPEGTAGVTLKAVGLTLIPAAVGIVADAREQKIEAQVAKRETAVFSDAYGEFTVSQVRIGHLDDLVWGDLERALPAILVGERNKEYISGSKPGRRVAINKETYDFYRDLAEKRYGTFDLQGNYTRGTNRPTYVSPPSVILY